MSTALATQQQNPVVSRQFDLSPQTFEQALTFCDYLANSDLVPKDFKGKPANCLIAMQWGAELGLKPLQALQNLAIINGRPALWGDAVLAIVRASPLCEYVTESDNGLAATCKVKRRGEPEEIREFSMDDAKTAGLIGKAGPWTQYPKRMRQMRARAFALRDVFADVLRGMAVAEELMDIQATSQDAPRAHVVEPQLAAIEQKKPEALPGYTDDEFAEKLPAWKKLIHERKQTAADVIAVVRCKRSLTEAQLQAIDVLSTTIPEAAPADPVDAGEHA